MRFLSSETLPDVLRISVPDENTEVSASDLPLYPNVIRTDFPVLERVFEHYNQPSKFDDEMWEYAFALQVALERAKALSSMIELYVLSINRSCRTMLIQALSGSYLIGSLPYAVLNDTPLCRYRAALHISVDSLIHKCITDFICGGFYEHVSEMHHHIFHNALFARPAIPNWISCPISQLHEMRQNVSKRLHHDAKWINIPNISDAGGRNLFHPSFLEFIRNARNIRASLKQIDGVEPEIPERKFVLVSPYFTNTKFPPEKIAPLPEGVSAIALNQASNAFIPAIYAQDEMSMTLVFIPSTHNAWKGMHRIYQIPEHDELYPESFENRTLLNPQSDSFPEFFQDRFDAAYIGRINIGQWLKNTEGEECDSDFMFHAFYLNREI